MDQEPAKSADEPGFLGWVKRTARRLKVEAHTLWLIFRHARTPWYVKALLVLLLLYLASPIDIIPDMIPILGMLDDLLVIGFSLWLVYRLVPERVVAECRAKAREADREDWVKALWQKMKEW